MTIRILTLALMTGAALSAFGQAAFESDVLATSAGEIRFTFIGHGTLMISAAGTVVHVDPWTDLADYARLPKAHIVLITHEHGDHLDPAALRLVRTDATAVLAPEACAPRIPGAVAMTNGASQTVRGIRVDAVPAYNLVHKRENGQPFHPPGRGNGYVLTVGDRRVYVAGDTENTPEMKALRDIDVAFLPMNLPYTMTPEMVADAARAFRPKILYPYHYGQTDPARLRDLLKDVPGVEVRIRRMK